MDNLKPLPAAAPFSPAPVAAPTPAPVPENTAVGLEGVPVTPESTAGAPIGPAVAVPSTDHTGSDVNADTSDFPPNASTSATPVSPAPPAGLPAEE